MINSEKTPLISKSFFSQYSQSEKEININEPAVTSSLLLQRVEKLLFLLKSHYEEEKKIFELQKIKSRNLFLKKAGVCTGSAVSTMGVSTGSMITGWTLYGIKSAQSHLEWMELGKTLRDKWNVLFRAWVQAKIPDENTTCSLKHGVNFKCPTIDLNLEPFCEELKKQHCEAFDAYEEWQESSRKLDELEMFLIIFASLATVATIMLIMVALWNRSCLYNMLPIRPKLSYFGDKSWNDPINQVNNLDKDERDILLKKLETLSGNKLPDSFDEFISYIEDIANQLRQHEKECSFMFYELENNRHNNLSDTYQFYEAILGTGISQMIIDYLAESAFDKPEKEQVVITIHDDEEQHSYRPSN